MYLAVQTGLQLGSEYQKRYDRVVIKTINGSIKNKKMQGDLERWKAAARATTFRQGLLQIGDQVGAGQAYTASFPGGIDTMD